MYAGYCSKLFQILLFLMCIMIVYLLINACLSGGNAFVPVYDPKVLPSSQCGQSNPFEDDQQLMERLKMIH